VNSVVGGRLRQGSLHIDELPLPIVQARQNLFTSMVLLCNEIDGVATTSDEDRQAPPATVKHSEAVRVILSYACQGSFYDTVGRIQSIVACDGQVLLGVEVDQWVLERGTGALVFGGTAEAGGREAFLHLLFAFGVGAQECLPLSELQMIPERRKEPSIYTSLACSRLLPSQWVAIARGRNLRNRARAN